MDRHRRVHVRVLRRRLRAPPRRLHVDPDGHQPPYADSLRRRHRVGRRTAHQVEVAVGVGDLDGQRLRRGRRCQLPRAGGGAGHQGRGALPPAGGVSVVTARSRSAGARELAPPPAPERLAVEVADAHCHLDLMGGSAADAVAAAQAVGVRRMVTIGIDVETSGWCAQAAAEHPDVYAAVAIHPNEASTASSAALAEIARLAALPQVRAVGETGLDYYRTTATPAQQQASFREHIAIAKATDRALVIHDREAHPDVLRLLAEEGAPERTLFHCFSGDAPMAAFLKVT